MESMKLPRSGCKFAVPAITVKFTDIIVIFLLALSLVSVRSLTSRANFTLFKLQSDHWWAIRSSPNPGLQGHPSRALIESIKEATRLASGTSSHQPSDESARMKEARRQASDGQPVSDDGSNEAAEIELTEWKLRNPCKSRLELMPIYETRNRHAKKLPPNPLWEELLVEYSKLHRVCMNKVGNLKDYFLTGNMSVAGCQFAVADAGPGTGLGNKFIVTASSALYAILTKRVILIPSQILVPDYTCEPFLGSSWKLDSKSFPVPHISNDEHFRDSLWTRNSEFFKEIDGAMAKMDHKIRNKVGSSRFVVPTSPLENAVGVLSHEWQPDNRFYCTAEQTFYSQSTWVYMSGCIYTIPKLFATPSFRPILEDLFPDKMVATRVLRSLLLPADGVWARVQRIHRAHLADADRQVGIQVRYKGGIDHYNSMNVLVNERIINCTESFAILPAVHSSSGHVGDSNLTQAQTVKVFVASLFPGLSKHLSRTFRKGPSRMMKGKEEVSVVQVSQDLTQTLDDPEEDQQAMAEVLLLSFSDQLIVTPLSTFGGLAQAYGALVPWFVEMREDPSLPPCERAQTVDLCNQFTDKHYRCPHDPAVDTRLFSDVLPYIKDCLTIDHSEGIQLITEFQT